MGFFSGIFGKKTETDIFNGYTDLHTHLLPGVDDGFRTVEDSLACLDSYAAYGFSDVWLTPHIMEDVPNTTEHLRERFTEFKEAYKGPIQLHLASENMIDALFLERLEAGDLLPMGNHLLVETSYFTAPTDFHEILAKIKRKGYYPLLAHPERYVYMDKKDYARLLENGIAMQLNMFSLTGAYGQTARDKALYLLSHGAYMASGTDIHRAHQSKGIDTITHNRNLNLKLTSSGLLNFSVLNL